MRMLAYHAVIERCGHDTALGQFLYLLCPNLLSLPILVARHYRIPGVLKGIILEKALHDQEIGKPCPCTSMPATLASL